MFDKEAEGMKKVRASQIPPQFEKNFDTLLSNDRSKIGCQVSMPVGVFLLIPRPRGVVLVISLSPSQGAHTKLIAGRRCRHVDPSVPIYRLRERVRRGLTLLSTEVFATCSRDEVFLYGCTRLSTYGWFEFGDGCRC